MSQALGPVDTRVKGTSPWMAAVYWAVCPVKSSSSDQAMVPTVRPTSSSCWYPTSSATLKVVPVVSMPPSFTFSTCTLTVKVAVTTVGSRSSASSMVMVLSVSWPAS